MRRRILTCAAGLALLAGAAPTAGQTWAVQDPVMQQIWQHGMEESQAMRIAQVLTDSIGPRLTGTPNFDAGVNWAVSLLGSWGVDARREQYGTWNGWRRGITHVDLIQPRVRSLEGMMLAWSPGTGGRPVEAQVVAVPGFDSAEAFEAWLPSVRGRVVAMDFPQPTCRPVSHYEQFGQTYAGGGGFGGGGQAQQGPRNAAERLVMERREAQQRFNANKPNSNAMRLRLEEAGAVAILQSNWSNDLGVNKVFSTNTQRTPTVDLSCEDYGLVYRLAANNQGPVVRIVAEAEDRGEVPAHNVVGMVRGSELPNEYVILSAHFDSWDGGSGATDNGTGTTTMLEAMRILRQVYPNPKRTILIALWGGEEHGLHGSRRFVAMHPDIVENTQALFNQDNGTGRVSTISFQGFTGVAPAFGDWMGRIPQQITNHISFQNPGFPGSGGTDHVAFVCAGAPAFNLSSNSWNYSTVTWHTNRDTFDKIVEEEVRNNATLTAMLVYLASEHPERLSRDRRDMGGNLSWPQCQPGATQSPRAAAGR
ncbi:MAG TPA: M20/M25/M40 family metallo-hydrolase [Longimicrobiales bacterium]|nr:M20/M25/M40 family metallo-hydrolase [Longimicrobiales bacterium]